MRKKPRVLRHPEMPVHVPRAHTVLATVVANAFEELGVSVALKVGREWYPIHNAPQMSSFEVEHGVESRRYAYNDRCFARVFRTRKAVLGTHAGFHDLFVPVGNSERPWGALATGPFSIARPTSRELLARWHTLSGAHGRLTDPGFYHYTMMTLGTLTLEGAMLEAFQRLVGCLARLLAAREPPDRPAAEAAALRIKLVRARTVERTWEAARTMIDARTSRMWLSRDQTNGLAFLRMSDPPEHAVVGLIFGRASETGTLDDLLQRDAFQRACVELGRKVGGVVAGRVGDHGVAMLVESAEHPARQRSALIAVGERTASLAQRFGFQLHVGVSQPGSSASLAQRYRAALSAAERALSTGAPMLHAGPEERFGSRQIAVLRRELAQAVAEPSRVLSPRFDRYLEVVAASSGYRLEPIRVQLEAGIERILEVLSTRGLVDEKSVEEMHREIDRAATEAGTVRDLFAIYRGLVSEIETALGRPTEGRQLRGTRRAMGFIREHLAEPLSLSKVARTAGVSPNYFSKLFKRRQGVTFEQFTQRLRVERAKGLLTGTSLSVAKVADLCGFRTGSYFHRVFKRAVGVTPFEFRRRDPALAAH